MRLARHPVLRSLSAVPISLALLLGACSSEDSPADTTSAAAPDTSAADTSVAPVETTAAPADSTAATTAAAPADSTAPGGTAISAERCAQNKAAGKLTYLSGFDYAAAAGIVEVIVAEEKGYFDALCLDVDVKSSFSTANYPLVASGKAQFASAGSYTELLRNTPPEVGLPMLYELGRTAIDALMVRADGNISALSDLKGKTIGVKGDLPPSIQVMLSKAGLVRDQDYQTTSVEGFNPVEHMKLPIDALPGYKSNEPGQLDAAGFKYQLFDPTDEDIPGSFGIVYTNANFAKDHPTAVEDFTRAALAGMADAAADPAGAVKICVDLITGSGNPNFLSPTGEGFRWTTEAQIIEANAGGAPFGVIDPAQLQEQVDAYTAAGIFPTKPSIEGTYVDGAAAAAYDASGAILRPIA